jgi:hypothetical protein
MESEYLGYAIITENEANGAPVTKGTFVGIKAFEDRDIQYVVISHKTPKNSSANGYYWYASRTNYKLIDKEDLSEIERIIFNIHV